MLNDFLEESKKEMEQNKRARSSGLAAGQPLHGPVIELLVELLKHSLVLYHSQITKLLAQRSLQVFCNCQALHDLHSLVFESRFGIVIKLHGLTSTL